MNQELKKQIVLWMLDNSTEFQLVIACMGKFRPYIFDADGNFLLGGEKVATFIEQQDKLLSPNY